jgi:23S rRNA pseudouridine2605 synthase
MRVGILRRLSTTSVGTRVNKFLSYCGFGSRSQIERIIQEGRVLHNGEFLDNLEACIKPQDLVEVDGQVAKIIRQPRIWTYYKPEGEILKKGQTGPKGGFRSAFRNIDAQRTGSQLRLLAASSLDSSSEGLVLLSNMPTVAHYLLENAVLPYHFKVRAFGPIYKEKFEQLAQQWKMDISVGKFSANSWFDVVAKGKGSKRDVKKAFEVAGLVVNRIICVQIGDFKLDRLRIGELQEARVSKTLENLLVPALRAVPNHFSNPKRLRQARDLAEQIKEDLSAKKPTPIDPKSDNPLLNGTIFQFHKAQQGPLRSGSAPPPLPDSGVFTVGENASEKRKVIRNAPRPSVASKSKKDEVKEAGFPILSHKVSKAMTAQKNDEMRGIKFEGKGKLVKSVKKEVIGTKARAKKMMYTFSSDGKTKVQPKRSNKSTNQIHRWKRSSAH